MFEGDELVQSWFVRHVQIIGEAVRTLPQSVRDRAPDIPRSKIIGMRHILVHDGFEIDADAVWEAAERDTPELERYTEALLDSIDGKAESPDLGLVWGSWIASAAAPALRLAIGPSTRSRV